MKTPHPLLHPVAEAFPLVLELAQGERRLRDLEAALGDSMSLLYYHLDQLQAVGVVASLPDRRWALTTVGLRLLRDPLRTTLLENAP
ncbi:MAG: hypothetical protein ACOC92_00720 [bacterium]